ncbi:MAG TPA: 4-hydroxy-3-methylbut-2-enyl diphosphate reductase [Caldimonas sp.]
MNLWLANPRGFCAGVERAVKIVNELISLADEPVYVRHEIVHNRSVVESLKARGAVFVEAVSEIPDGAFAVISAHGAPPEVFAQARAAHLRLFDSTCPLVTKVHLEVLGHARAGRAVLLIGHRDHVEVTGTLGHYDNPAGGGIQVVEDEQEARTVQVPDPSSVAYVTQTTLAVDTSNRIVSVLRDRFPALVGPRHDDICYATQNRQDAVRLLCARCERVIVIGAPHSSNSLRMVEVAQETGTPAHLIESADELQADWFRGAKDVGLTSSASAPEHLVESAVKRMRTLVGGELTLRELGRAEGLVFKLPTPLLDMRESRRPCPSVALASSLQQ